MNWCKQQSDKQSRVLITQNKRHSIQIFLYLIHFISDNIEPKTYESDKSFLSSVYKFHAHYSDLFPFIANS